VSILRRSDDPTALVAMLEHEIETLGRENLRLQHELTERDRSADNLAQLEHDEAQEQARREAEARNVTRRLLEQRKVEADAAEQLARLRGIEVPAGASTAGIVALLREGGASS
jgi:hypothetical protein